MVIRVKNSLDGERFPHPICFIEGQQFIPSPVIFSLEGATGKHGPVSEYPRALSVVTDRRKRKQSAVKHMHVK